MDKQDKNKSPESSKENKKSADQKASTRQAEQEANRDIAADPDLSIHSPNDDLDEGELARLGESNNPIE